MEMGEFFYTGLLVDGARLTRRDRAMVKTRAGTDMEEDVTNAMIELAPELEGEPGCPIGYSEPNAAARQGDEFLVQRGESTALKYGKKEVNAVEAELPPWEEVENELDDDYMAEDEADQLPPELVEASHEAYAMHFKAKQKIAEVKKLRQYFRRPEQMLEERKKIIAEKMKTAPCHKCRELGHWSRECPQRGHATGAASWRSSKQSQTKGSASEDRATLVALCHRDSSERVQSESSYKGRHGVTVAFKGNKNKHIVGSHETFWCQRELKYQVILDLGCVRSVVGLKWMTELLHEWKNQQRWVRIFPEKEQFQFGNMQTPTSKFRVHFEVVLAGVHVAIPMSVVPGDCPPLLSRHACRQLGLSIDCGSHSVSSSKMNVKNFGMSQAGNGHYILSLHEFSSASLTDIPSDFMVPSGFEAHILLPRSLEVTRRRHQFRGVELPPHVGLVHFHLALHLVLQHQVRALLSMVTGFSAELAY